MEGLAALATGAKTTEVEARIETYFRFVDHQRLVAHRQYKFFTTVVGGAAGKNHT